MAVKSLPLDYDIVVYAATSYRREFRWLPDGVNPLDFTGWGALMLLGNPGSPADVTLTQASGITLTPIGQIIVDLTPEQTSSLTPPVAYYNLDLIEPTGFVRRFLRGRISVVVDVQKALP